MFTGTPSVPDMIGLAQQAERSGFETIWVAETRITRDAFVPATAIAQATETIRIGTGIVNVFTRNPVLMASTFLGMDELAPGRVIIGLGAGSSMVLGPQGIDYHKPLTRLREYAEVIPRLMRGETVDFDGSTVTLRDARIEDVLSVGDRPLRAELPLYLAVDGPKAMRYAGGVGDGVLMDICLPTSAVQEKLRILSEGAEEAGRTRADLDVGAVLLCSPNEDEQVGRAAARFVISLYLGSLPHLGTQIGLPDEVTAAVGKALATEGIEAAARLVPDAAVDQLAVAGTPEQCRSRIQQYRDAGLDFVVLAPVESAIRATVDLLAPDGEGGLPGPRFDRSVQAR
ncbi:LLM class flavin-dependent oxidoreductase [Streptomyces sp. NPDC001663]|uniref:LLM class flavin-dependent oxidoreductase n=1 Tax=Streptomyces sp. NPDC001663 TaxID=3364597 RepID=UPI003697EEE4